ncbi:hypothetical protein K438DRAFT_1976663 [Mycena galopus ATCC 62051]|nr:hypothetical protein K438DRAFT_1976663 [Mycena galopus ATCC 62051]
MMEGDSLLPLHTDALRVAIVAENFLPKIDGSTITLVLLLQHLHSTGIRAMLLGPETGMASYAGASLFGTFGVPLRVYPGLKVNFISPAFLAALRQFAPHGLAALTLLFPNTPIVTSHHTNLPTYATVFGYPYYHFRTWAVHAYLHSFARYTLVPSRSTASLLTENGFGNLRVVGLGVDDAVFHFFPLASPPCVVGARLSDLVILSVGRLSPEKNPGLLVHTYSALSTLPSAHIPLCVELPVPAIFTRQLTDRRLTEAFTSGDVISFVCTVTPRVDAVASALPVFFAKTKLHERAYAVFGVGPARDGLLLAENGGSTDGGDALFSRITIL